MRALKTLSLMILVLLVNSPVDSIVVVWSSGSSYNPDLGAFRNVILVDGNFPAKPIRLQKGSQFKFTYTNNIKDEVSDLHCHGIYQKKTNLSDGVGFISQCPPKQGQSFNYNINIEDQTGTYFCHSHTGTQLIDGLSFPLIIEDKNDYFLEKFKTSYSDKDRICGKKKKIVCPTLFYNDHTKCNNQIDEVIMLSDWTHKIGSEVFADYLADTTGDEPLPDSCLINGIGDVNCKEDINKCRIMYKTKIIKKKGLRFRIINNAAMAVFHFGIQGHKLHIIEIDGIIADGKTSVDILRINAGQRYSVIVKADKPAKKYVIRAMMDPNIYPSISTIQYNPLTYFPIILGTLTYVDSDCKIINNTDITQADFDSMNPLFLSSLDEAKINIDHIVNPNPKIYSAPPKRADKTFVMEISSILKTPNGHPFFGFNNHMFGFPSMSTTLLYKVLKNLNYDDALVQTGPVDYYEGYNAIKYEYGDVVDFIYTNSDPGEHPIHWHGHSCYVMYQGKTNTGYKNYNFEYDCRVPYRDVATINPNSAMVVRCIADNPGVWVAHCHIAWHLETGLMFSMVESTSKIKKLYTNDQSKLNNCGSY